MAGAHSVAGGRGWAHRYPPLTAIVVALVLAVFALPSALNLPQANPGQTLEYAPVPGDQGKAPPGGNIAGLGLGSTIAGLASGGQGGTGPGGSEPPPPPLPVGQGTIPSTKRCVGNPPRQTEDPLSPPCVAFFSGNNGGKTYQGVTSNEINILWYFDDFYYDDCTSNGTDPPPNTYYDLAKAPDPSENTCWTRVLRNWQRYFNDRYQTYGRFVHFYVYISQGTTSSPSQRRADVAANFEHLHPFAAFVGGLNYGYGADYRIAMLQKGVTWFTGASLIPAADYQAFAPLMWGYNPSQEQQAESFVALLCRKVAPYQVHFSGNGDNGAQRKYGLVLSRDQSQAGVRHFQDLVTRKAQAQCGMAFADTATYPINGQVVYQGPQNNDYNTYAVPQMQRFMQEKITTIIWPAGYENQFSKAAGAIGYKPEWVLAGDNCCSDGYFDQGQQDQTVWAHAYVATPVVRVIGTEPQSCLDAYREVDPTASGTTAQNDLLYACNFYTPLRQLFTGIQVAGPRLTPVAVDQGFHAIPQHTSSSPDVPACYYLAGDYTCVKDAELMWYDPTATNALGNSGCWRMVQGGLRFTANSWSSGNLDTQSTANDPCNGFRGAFTAEFYLPTG
ncbi:MAG: hypothetical protein ACYDGR_04485 [Candidatus Dormibacteria bacterium]